MLDFVSLLNLEYCFGFRYFVAAPENKPGERHLYRTGDLNISSPDTREMDCLTCPPLEPSQNPLHHGLESPHNTAMEIR